MIKKILITTIKISAVLLYWWFFSQPEANDFVHMGFFILSIVVGFQLWVYFKNHPGAGL